MKISQEVADDAVRRIIERHLNYGDPHLPEIGEGASNVLSYLQRYWTTFPQGVQYDDLDDVPYLHIWTWWQHQHQEMYWMDQVVRARANRARFMVPFGVESPAGFNCRRSRLHSLLDPTGSGRPSEKDAYADRAAAVREPVDWMAAARDQVLACAREAMEFYYLDIGDDAAEELIEVRAELKAGRYGAGTISLIGSAIDALASCEDPELAERAAPLAQRWQHLMLQRAAAEATA